MPMTNVLWSQWCVLPHYGLSDGNAIYTYTYTYTRASACTCAMLHYTSFSLTTVKRFSHLLQDGGQGISIWFYLLDLDQTWQVSLLQTWRWWTKWYCTPCYKGGKWRTHLTTPYTHTHIKILGICHDTPYFIAHACVYSYACAILHYMCILSHTRGSGILIWCKMVDEAFPDDSTLVD